MPIYEWQYRGEARRHIGPMAQDFHKAFNLGDDDKTIATIDADGVALAAIKAQQEIIEKQQTQIDDLRQELDDFKIMMGSKRVKKLKHGTKHVDTRGEHFRSRVRLPPPPPLRNPIGFQKVQNPES